MASTSEILNSLGKKASSQQTYTSPAPAPTVSKQPESFVGKSVKQITGGIGESLGAYWTESKAMSQLPMTEQIKMQAQRTGSLLYGLGKFAGSMAIGLFRYPLQAGAKLGLSGIEEITGKKQDFTPQSDFGRFLWGEELTTLQTGKVKISGAIEEVGGTEWEEKYLPAVLVTGSLGLDLFPGLPKGTRAFTNALRKETTEEGITILLKQAVKKKTLVLTDDVIGLMAKDIASSNDPKQIQKYLQQAQKLAVESGATIPKAVKDKAQLVDIRSRLSNVTKKTTVTNSAYHKTARELNVLLNKSETSLRSLELKRFRERILFRNAKTKIVTDFKAKKKSLELMQKDVFQFAKDWLPKEQFTKVARDITRIKTRTSQLRATRNIIIQRRDNLRKEAVDSLDRVIKDLGDLPITSQDKITKLTENLRFFKTTERSEEKLQKLREFLEAHPAEKFKLESKKNLSDLAKLTELDKAPLSEIPLDELIALADKTAFISKEGKLINASLHGKTVKGQKIEGLLKLEEENMVDALSKESFNLDSKTLPIDTLAKTLSKQEKQANLVYQTSQQLRKGELNYHNSDVVFEMLDGQKLGLNSKLIKQANDEALDLAEEATLKYTKRLADTEKAILKEFGIKEFTSPMYEKVYIYALTKQLGGIKKLKLSGVSDKIIASAERLSPPENRMYRFMRNQFDELHPKVDATMREVHKKKVGFIENYFPLRTDFDDADTVVQRIMDNFDRKNIQKGFTQERKLLGGKKLNLSAKDIYIKYANDANYFIEVEGMMTRTANIIKNQKYRDSVGKVASNWLDTYVDLIARKGVPAGYRFNWVDILKRNIGAAVLGFNPSPIIKQPLAKFTSVGFLGKHSVIHDKEFMFGKLSRPNLSVMNAIKKASLQQKLRVADDPAYTELARGKKLSKLQQKGYAGIKAVDAYTAHNTWYGAYKKFFADEKLAYNLDDFLNGKVNKEGVRYADRIVRITQGSGKFKDLPQMLTSKNKKLMTSIFQFQSFVLNQSQILTYHAVRKEALGKKNILGATALAAPLVGVAYVEDLIDVLKAQIYGSETYKERLSERTKKDIALDLIGNIIPPLGLARRFVTDTNTGVPVIDIPKRLAQSGGAIITAKETETKVKNGIRVLEAGLTVAGIPATGFAGTLTRRGTEIAMMTNVDKYVLAIKAGDGEEAENVLRRAMEKDLNVVAIQKAAVTRLKRERTAEATETAEKIRKELSKMKPEKRREFLKQLEEEGVLTPAIIKAIIRINEREALKKSRGE